jgi:uncharacterized protein
MPADSTRLSRSAASTARSSPGSRRTERARNSAGRAHPEGDEPQVHAVPGARATEVAGLHGGALRVRVAAPPVDGKANAALLAFLAARLGLRPRDLRLAAGGSGRDKLVVIPGRTPEQARAALAGPGRA